MIGRLWTFSGLDGAGKSTQIELLQQGLMRRGRRNRRVWARGGYTPLFDFAKGLVRRVRPTGLPAPGRSQERTARFRSPLVRRTWLALAMIDLGIYYGLWVRGLRLSGCHVVADRWLEDTELDFRLNFPEEAATEWILWQVVRWLSPRPDVRFVLVIPVDESLRRSVEKNEPFPDSAEVLRRRLDYYENMARRGPAHLLDGREARAELHARILQLGGVHP